MSLLDLIIFFALTGGNVVVGAFFYFKNRSGEQFITGGGNIPAWLAGMSIFATYVSSISFLALPGKTYVENWNPLVFSFSIPFAAWLAVKYFVPHYRRQNSISAYAYLEQRFGLWARLYAASCYLLTQLMRSGAILLLLALTLHTLFGWSITIVIILTGMTVTLYALLGGIKAVLWTDAIQGFILIVGALVCAAVLSFTVPGGPGQVWQVGQSHGKFSLGSFSGDLTTSTFWVVLVYGLFINLQNYGIDQNYIQRYLTTSTDRAAKLSAWWGALLYLPVSLLFCYIGSALFAYYHIHPGDLPSAGTSVLTSDQVFPYFIAHGLPTGLKGLLVAAIFAAGMSTISTSVNSAATIIYSDYIVRLIKSKTFPRPLWTLRVVSLAFGLASTLIALGLVGVSSVLDSWWSLASIFSGGMLGLFLLGFLSDRIKNLEAAMGVILGVLLIIWMSLSPLYLVGKWKNFSNPWHPNLTIVVGTAVIFLGGFLFMKIIRPTNKA